MSHFVRASKYRHVFVEAPKPQDTFSGLRLSSAVGEQNYIKGNSKFFAVALSVCTFSVSPYTMLDAHKGECWRLDREVEGLSRSCRTRARALCRSASLCTTATPGTSWTSTSTPSTTTSSPRAPKTRPSRSVSFETSPGRVSASDSVACCLGRCGGSLRRV